MKSPIKAISFDVGGTLIQPWPSVGAIYSRIAQKHGHNCTPDDLNARFATAWGAKGDFNHSRDQWRSLVWASFGSCPVSDAIFDDIYAYFATAEAWRVFDDVLPTLTGLKAQGIRMGIISNWDERLRPLLKDLNLDSFFDAFSISVEIGAAKPNARIFQHAVQQLRVAPESILHVGDTEDEDIAGARECGFQALRIDRTGHSKGKGTVISLSELLSGSGGI